MKIKFTYLLFATFVLSLSGVVSAQERSGFVMDNHGEPVDMATVVLLAGGRQAAVAVTDTAGRFALIAADGEYEINIRYITHSPIKKMIELKTGVGDMGQFIMEESIVGLQEVVVSASVITREADRFVMRIIGAPSMLSKDAAEILRLAPGVWVDDTGISINGMRGSTVFINERELKLPAEELAGYLRNLQSSDIARIEVIPQTGAEYSADSRGGAIRIILRKQSENGVSGNISIGTSLGEYINEYHPSATVNSRIGQLTLNTFASATISPKSESEMTTTRTYESGGNSSFHSRSFMKEKIHYGTGRIGAVYEPDNKNSFGVEFEYISKDTKTPSIAETVIRESGSNAIETHINSIETNAKSDYRQNEDDKNLSATFNYVYRLDTLGSVLKFISDYTNKKVGGDNDYNSSFEIKGIDMPEIKKDSVYRNNTSSDYRIFSADLSLNKQLGNGMKFLAGAKYTRNDMSDTVSYESHYLQNWKPLTDYSFAINYTEDISAVYGTFAANMGGLSMTAGVRVEHTYTKGRSSDISNSYVDFFPNVNLTYSFNAMRTFMLISQFSRNIQRPNFWYLNPNRVQFSDYSYMTGNPNLRPTYINRFSLTAVYKYRYVLSTGGTLHHDLIREVCKIDPSNPDLTYITPENHYMENHYYVALSFPFQPVEWLNANFNLVGVKQDIRGVKGGDKMSHYLYFNNVTTNLTLPEKFIMEISYSGTSRLYSANSGVEPRQIFNVAIKRKLFVDRITTSLGVNNIFDSKVAYFSTTERFTANAGGREALSSRFIKLSIQYNFSTGKSFKKRDVERVSESEKSRLEKSHDAN